MSNPDNQNGLMETAFHLDSVFPTEDPTGEGATWFRYVISQGPNGENAITGAKSGSLTEVRAQLLDMVTRLNERFGKLQAKKK